MQTFLPYSSYYRTARCLDYRRLNKQRIEAKQIYLAITIPDYGWQNHPAVNMWRGYEVSLSVYGYYMCIEWAGRGYKDNVNLTGWFHDRIKSTDDYVPPWLGNERFHSSHRAALLYKDFNYYSKFGWDELPALNYYWPTGVPNERK